MTTEELLRPRYKVIATWPGMAAEPFRLGEIVTLQPSDDGFIHIPVKHNPGSYMRVGFFALYPHLFKKLAWWEERKPEEMPEYLTCLSNDFNYKKGDIIKVGKWVEAFGPTLRFYPNSTDKITLHPHVYTPATREEYEAYLKTQT